MKKHILLILSFLFLGLALQAQKGRRDYKKIRAYKMAFISEKLDLTEEEAQKFWPIYNDYNKKISELYRSERLNVKKRIFKKGGIEKLSEEEAKTILEEIKSIQQQKAAIKTKLLDKVSTFLSYKKTLILEIAEHEFNKKLIRKIRGKRKFKKEK
ncbi:hypothetical protein [Tenacibaculum sp. 190524A02b]|uniref:hypothetical protein n=1 Tax=Tenacibaculum vairaonense TaxID=3137860 RepID=UPI0032B1D97A